MTLSRMVISAGLALTTSACGDMRPTDPGRIGSDGRIVISQPRPGSALEGTWSFTRYFYDEVGNRHGSQTVWTFLTGGRVTRTVYSDNFTAGIGDVITIHGTWTATASTVDVRFNGSTTAVRYDYHFEGATLVLAGTAFIRLSR